MSRGDLTPIQADALAALRCHLDTYGWAPTACELMKPLGLRRSSQVDVILMALSRKGYVVRGHGPRCLRLTPKAIPPRDESFLQAIAAAEKEEIARLCVDLFAEVLELRRELAGKSEAVHVQGALRRIESVRRRKLSAKTRQLREQLAILNSGGESN